MTFDYFKICFPDSAIQIIDSGKFTQTISNDGVITNQKYKQEKPFLFEISIDMIRRKTFIKFSGKSLLENYPDLISSSNIDKCFDNINDIGICQINPDVAIKSAIVYECDITADRPYTGSIGELMNSVVIKNPNYTITQKSPSRFYLQSTYVTKRKRECLVVYDKGTEMRLKSNEPFLSSVRNSSYQLEYFSDKIRFELNLRSMDRIRKYLPCTDMTLGNILEHPADPIASFLDDALTEDNLIDALIHKTPKLRELEHLILMLLCGWDLPNIERVIRKTTGKKNSISTTLAPYKALYQRLNNTIVGLTIDEAMYKLQDRLIDMIVVPLHSTTNDTSHSLRSLYNQQSTTIQKTHPDIPALFCLKYVCIPTMPD